MKIAHLTTVDLSLRYLILPQLEAALEAGEVIGISAPGEFVPELEEMGIRHVPLHASTRGFDPFADVRSAIQLWRILKREKPDILHTHNPKPGVYGRIVGRLAGVPIVVNTIHGLYASEDSSIWKRVVVYGLEWLASRFSDAELVQNPEDFALLNRLRITPKPRTRLLGNGVDLSRFTPEVARTARAGIRSELGVEPGQVVVGTVGRLVEEKGLPELIDLAERLDEGYLVVVVGPSDPEKADALELSLIERGQKAGVRFLGMRRDVESLYGGFDMFVLPSHREGFPRAAMEAAASGLPVIATDIRGCRQVVDDGRNGVLFPLGDVDRFETAVKRLGEDEALRIHMGEESGRRSRSDFDERDVVERVMDVYREVCSRKGVAWDLVRDHQDVAIRVATVDDARAMAALHHRTIDTGFLSKLGVGFLTILYHGLVRDSGSFCEVVESDGLVVGFISGTADTGAFYRRFVRRYWLRAGLSILPSLFRVGVIRRIVETLRYGAEESRAEAELLSMAVAPSARGRGLGSSLVADLLRWAGEKGIQRVKVVVGAANQPAITMYEKSGFADAVKTEVHQQTPSWELVWTG